MYKDFREFYCYRFPASSSIGKSVFNDIDKIIERCTMMCEIAQYNSAQLEACIEKNIEGGKLDTSKLEIDKSIIEKGYTYQGHKVTFMDQEDWYRLNYICKGKYATSILYMLREGMIEDFFGSWYPEEGELEEGQFNPDYDLQVIFDLP